jgi:hypothetical protein
MFKVISRIKPKTILSNLENINASILQENSKMREDPCRQNEKEKPLIAIPLEKDLYNYLARYRKKALINGSAEYYLGNLTKKKIYKKCLKIIITCKNI